MTKAIDVSVWQGVIDWPKVDAPIALIKFGGADDGLYYDSKAFANYKNAKAAGKAVGMYWFAGGTDPIKEADYYLKGCAPFEQDDVYVLDWEVPHTDPVGWCKSFIQRVIEKTGTKPLIYMNTSTENAHDWMQIVKMDIGLWVADYRFSPIENVPIHHWSTYVMHQYSSTGRVTGISGNVDLNEWFGSVEQFKKYGYRVPAPTPTPTPTPPTDPCAEVKAENLKIRVANDDLAKTVLIKDNEIKRLGDEITKLQAELAASSNDTSQLNALGTLLQWLISRLGLKKG